MLFMKKKILSFIKKTKKGHKKNEKRKIKKKEKKREKYKRKQSNIKKEKRNGQHEKANIYCNIHVMLCFVKLLCISNVNICHSPPLFLWWELGSYFSQYT